MNYQEEIEYREMILTRIANREKLRAEDRLWLATHRIYHRTLGYPYLNTDIVSLRCKTKYTVRIEVEKIAYPRFIIPVISVPGGKGNIVTNFELTNLDGETVSKKTTKILGVLVNAQKPSSEFIYHSDLGLMGISFECEYYDDKLHLLTRKDSNLRDPDFAMFGEILSENKMRYHCKPPMSKCFDDYVFSIEWNPLERV